MFIGLLCAEDQDAGEEERKLCVWGGCYPEWVFVEFFQFLSFSFLRGERLGARGGGWCRDKGVRVRCVESMRG